MGLSHGRAVSTFAACVGAGLVADKAGVEMLSDHGPKTSPSLTDSSGSSAFPLALLSQARAGFSSSSRALLVAGGLEQAQAALEENEACLSLTPILLW